MQPSMPLPQPSPHGPTPPVPARIQLMFRFKALLDKNLDETGDPAGHRNGQEPG